MRLAIPRGLIEAARDSDGDDMERLLQVLWPHAFRIARSIVQSDALAEDAAQEACAVIYRQMSQLRNIEAFRVWVYRIVTREALRIAKRDVAAVAAKLAPEATYEKDVEQRIDVLRALAHLPANLRAVIVLHYYAELQSGEMAAVLGIPSPTVRFRLVRARQCLKQRLSSEIRLTTATEASQ